MLRTLSSLAVLVLVAACADDGVSTGEPPARPRNVLLISIDTLRPDHLGCYGYARDTSPTIDALAREGTLFLDVSSSSPWTLPAHATMLTGLYPKHHGVREERHGLSDDMVTLAEELRAAGLRTAAVVNSFYVGGPAFKLGQGFEFFDGVPEREDDPVTGVRRIVNNGALVVEQARRRLGELQAGEPFFLFLHFYDVHSDFSPSPAYREQFVGPYAGKLDGSTAQLAALRERGKKLPADDLRFLRELYDAEIRELDDHLAGFFDWMRGQGLFDETLIVVTSDHGEEFGEHGSLLHGRTHYQEVLAVPLVLHGPGVPAGRRIGQPAGLVDIVPTVLARLSITPSAPHDGVDLFEPAVGQRVLFSEADHNNREKGVFVSDTRAMVRVGDDKLVHHLRTRRSELYDLGKDAEERIDVSGESPETVERLLEELADFLSGARRPHWVGPPGSDDARTLRAAGYAGGDVEDDEDE